MASDTGRAVIAELFAGLAVAGAGAAVWGWRAASAAKDRALAELEWRRKGEVAAGELAAQLRGERDIAAGNLITVRAKLVQAEHYASQARTQAIDAERRLQELYAVIKKSGLSGGRARVLELMQEAADRSAVPTDPDPDAG